MTGSPDTLLLAGPTASGKTALSLHAARSLDAEILNADSMQVYSGLQLISARPTAEEIEGVPHHLFGKIDPSIRYSVGDWSRAALDRMADIRSRGKKVVIIGGTGLYFKALTEGLAPVPEIPEEVRQKVDQIARLEGLDALEELAEEYDPDGVERIKPGDRQRLQRIAEVGLATGQALSVLQAETRPMLKPGSWHGVVIKPDRAELYERIERRFDQMIEEGALEEARKIDALGLAQDLPAMKAVGLPPLLAHVRGEMSLEKAIDLAKRDTRRYAKRQFTWFSNQTPEWHRVTSLDPDEAKAELDLVLARFSGKS